MSMPSITYQTEVVVWVNIRGIEWERSFGDVWDRRTFLRACAPAGVVGRRSALLTLHAGFFQLKEFLRRGMFFPSSMSCS